MIVKNKLTAITILSLLLSAQALNTRAQGVMISTDDRDINISGNVDRDMKGTRYLYPNWEKGVVKLANGTVYKDLSLKYDLIGDILIFKAENQALQAFEQPVKEFTLIYKGDNQEVQRTFRNSFPNLEGNTDKNFYEILSEGKILLIKRVEKKVVEERGAGSILTSKQIEETTKYYAGMGNKFTRIKKDKQSVLNVLQDKAPQISSFIKDNNIDLKKEANLRLIFTFYNKL